MGTPLRTAQAGTFFVTSATHDRWPLFKRPETCELFLETLQHYRREGKYLLHDYVVMPDHIHLLLTPQDLPIERVVQLIKGGFSHRYGSKHPVWQKGFTDHRCRDRVDFLARRKYIRQNPVTARLVQYAEDYPYSSAFRKAPSAAEPNQKRVVDPTAKAVGLKGLWVHLTQYPP